MKKYFHSGKANVGMQLYENWDLEFSYQQSGEIKGRTLEGKRGKNYFSVYALDAYGKYPMFCSNLSLLGTVGAGIYHAKYKNFPKTSYNKVGYRAGLGLQYDFKLGCPRCWQIFIYRLRLYKQLQRSYCRFTISFLSIAAYKNTLQTECCRVFLICGLILILFTHKL